MLSSMRSSRKILSIVLWIVIIAFVSTIFVVWGIGSQENQSSYVIKVGDDVVGYEEYRTFYDNTVANLRNMLGDAYNMFAENQNMDSVVISELTNRKLMLQEAKRLNIPVADVEVIDAIKAVPAFQNDKGQFDPDIYVQSLSYFRQTPSVFESAVRDDLLVSKFQSLISNAQYAVSEDEILNEYNYRNTKAKISYFSLPISDFIPKSNISDEELSKYYEENKLSYEIPTKIKLKYIVFDKNSYTNPQEKAEISIKEVEDYYNANKSAYSTPASVVMRNVAVAVPNWNDESEVKKSREKIDKALSELKNGADFKAVVKKYADSLVASNDGVVGRVYEGQLEPEFEKAVFSTEVGKFTDVLKADYGFHIVYVDEKTPAKVYSMEEKLPEITDILMKNRKETSYRNSVLNTYKEILNAGNITAFKENNKDNNLAVVSTDLFDVNNPALPVFLSNQDALKNIFILNKTELSSLIEDGDISYLFEVEDKIPAIIPPLNEIKDKVIKAYREKEAEKIAVSDVEKALESGFNNALKTFKAKAIKTEEFKRSAPDSSISSSKELVNSIFSAKNGDTIKKAYIIGDNVYAVEVNNIIKPTKDDYVSEKDAIATYIRSIKSEEAVSSYIDSLKAKTKIQVNPAFLPEGSTN